MLFQLLYSERGKQYGAIVLVPLFFMLLYTVVIYTFPALPGLHSWMLILLISASSLGSLVYLYRFHLVVPCSVSVNEQGIRIRRQRRTLLYMKKDILLPWKNLLRMDNRMAEEVPAVELRLKKPRRVIRLEAANGHSGELFRFSHSVKLQMTSMSLVLREKTSTGNKPRPPADEILPEKIP